MIFLGLENFKTLGIWGFLGGNLRLNEILPRFLRLNVILVRLECCKTLDFWAFGWKSEAECDSAETRPLRQTHNSHISAGGGKGRP